MMNVYLIHPAVDGFTAEEVRVIKAKNSKEARNKAVRLFSKDEMFREYVRDLSVNLGFVSMFFEDEDGNFVDDYGFYNARMLNMFGNNFDKLEEYIEVKVELNIRKFFDAKEEFADILVRPFLKGNKIVDNIPDEMFEYILDKEDFNYYGGMVLKKINFDD